MIAHALLSGIVQSLPRLKLKILARTRRKNPYIGSQKPLFTRVYMRYVTDLCLKHVQDEARGRGYPARHSHCAIVTSPTQQIIGAKIENV